MPIRTPPPEYLGCIPTRSPITTANPLKQRIIDSAAAAAMSLPRSEIRGIEEGSRQYEQKSQE